IVAEFGQGTRAHEPAGLGLAKVVSGEALADAVATSAQTRLSDELVDYIVRIVRATREASAFELGASPRAAAMLASAARARAALDGRDYAIPDDVKLLAPSVLRHRVLLSPAAEIEGRTADTALPRS